MKIKQKDGGESPDFGVYEPGDINEVDQKTGDACIKRGLAEEVFESGSGSTEKEVTQNGSK